MGRIHEALKRAEEERARRQGERVTPVRRPILEPLGETIPIWTRRDPDPVVGRRPPVEFARADLAPAVLDEFSMLRVRIQSLRRQRKMRSLVIASPGSGEGRTTTAIELARAYAVERESDTCLVDLDLQNPRIHESVPHTSGPGLVDVLEGSAVLEDVLAPVSESRVYVLPAGTVPVEPGYLLDSLAMVQLIERLQQRFGLLIVDSPPILRSTDAAQTVALFDALLLVVRSGYTTLEDIDRCLERFDGDKLIGTVLNEGRVADRY